MGEKQELYQGRLQLAPAEERSTTRLKDGVLHDTQTLFQY